MIKESLLERNFLVPFPVPLDEVFPQVEDEDQFPADLSTIIMVKI